MNFQDFQFIYYRHHVFAPIKPLPSEKLLFYELTVVNKGEIVYFVNGNKYPVKENCAIFLPYGSIRMRQQSDAVDFVSFNFQSETPLSFPALAPSFIDEEVVALLKSCDIFAKNKSGHFKEKYVGVLYALVTKLYDHFNAPKYSPLTSNVIHYLEKHIAKNVTLLEIEQAVFYSPNYFNEKFKKETGTSVMKYFNLLKMERAKTLLFEQSQSLKDIACSLGFLDYNYFSRLFKQTYGVSPLQYKKQFLLQLYPSRRIP